MDIIDFQNAQIKPNGAPPPQDRTSIVGGIERREFHIKAGSLLLNETHAYDHLSFLLSGDALLRVDGEVIPLSGPCAVEIKAGIEHALFAVTDVVWDCLRVFSLAEKE